MRNLVVALSAAAALAIAVPASAQPVGGGGGQWYPGWGGYGYGGYGYGGYGYGYQGGWSQPGVDVYVPAPRARRAYPGGYVYSEPRPYGGWDGGYGYRRW